VRLDLPRPVPAFCYRVQRDVAHGDPQPGRPGLGAGQRCREPRHLRRVGHHRTGAGVQHQEEHIPPGERVVEGIAAAVQDQYVSLARAPVFRGQAPVPFVTRVGGPVVVTHGDGQGNAGPA
jgi:hypothetical protein